MNEEACIRCGSYADECDCCTEIELATLAEGLGMRLDEPLSYTDIHRARQIALDNDVAALQRGLREWRHANAWR